jgi:hypothetical protein
MGYKKIDRHLGFADLALASSLKHNRSLKFMDELNHTIDWGRVNQILMSHYTVGTSGEGAGAWPPSPAVQVHDAPKVVPHPIRSGTRKPDQ